MYIWKLLSLEICVPTNFKELPMAIPVTPLAKLGIGYPLEIATDGSTFCVGLVYFH